MAPHDKAVPGRWTGRCLCASGLFRPLVVFATTSCIQGQQASQSNKVSYDGHKVATAELVANPKISVDSLRSLVQQKIYEPYAASKIESTISGLRGTGRFSSVEVEVKPDPGGLRVTFTLEPALYFGLFDFPGATKHFSYRRLLQVVDIPNQTPFKQDVVSKADDNLRQFFVSAGYFQAEVQSEPQFDEAHLLANRVPANTISNLYEDACSKRWRMERQPGWRSPSRNMGRSSEKKALDGQIARKGSKSRHELRSA